MNEEDSVTAKSSLWCLAVWDEQRKKKKKVQCFQNRWGFCSPKLGLMMHEWWRVSVAQDVWNASIGVKVSVKVQILKQITVCSISSEPLNLLLPNLIWWCIIKSRSVEQMFGMLSSRSRSQWRFESSANVCLCCFLNSLQPNKWN